MPLPAIQEPETDDEIDRRIAAQLDAAPEAPAGLEGDEPDEIDKRIASTIATYDPGPLEKAAIGASEGLAAMAEAPDLAFRALERYGIPRETLLQLIPNIREGAERMAAHGQALRQAAREASPPETRDQSIAGQLPFVAGQAAPLIASGGLGTLAAAATGAAQTAVPMFYDILEATGGDENKAFAGAALGLGIGATEAIGVGGLLGKLNKASNGGVTRFLSALATEGLEEGGQEFWQQTFQDAAETALTPKEMSYLDRLESSGKAGALGLVFGVLAGGAGHGIKGGIDAARGARGGPHGEGGGTDVAPPAAATPPGKSIEQVGAEARGPATTEQTPSATEGGVSGESATGDAPTRGEPSGGPQPPPAQSAAAATYAHTEEPAENSSVQPGDKLGPLEVVPIDSLREFNPKKQTDPAKVAEMAQAMRDGRPLPPVIFHREADGSRVFDDGSNRAAAAKLAGFESVPAREVNPKTAKPEEPAVVGHGSPKWQGAAEVGDWLNWPDPQYGSEVRGPVVRVEPEGVVILSRGGQETFVPEGAKVTNEGKSRFTKEQIAEGEAKFAAKEKRAEIRKRLGLPPEELPAREVNPSEEPKGSAAVSTPEQEQAAQEDIGRIARDIQRHVAGQISPELLAQADTDPLTGLANRRADAAQSARVERVARKKGEKVIRFFGDLDNFKAVNTQFGYAGGDRAIKIVADAWAQAAREGEGVLPARKGGDEFVTTIRVTKDADVDAIRDRMEKVAADALEAAGMGEAMGKKIAASIGWVETAEGESLDDATKRAAIEAKKRKTARGVSKTTATGERAGETPAAGVESPGAAEPATAREQPAAGPSRPLSPEEEAAHRILRGEELTVEELQKTPKAVKRASEMVQRGEKPRAKKTPKLAPAAEAEPTKPEPTAPAAHVKPGDIVTSAGETGFDRVLRVHENKAGSGPFAEVQAVERAASGEWVPAEFRVRNRPLEELRRAPGAKAAAAAIEKPAAEAPAARESYGERYIRENGAEAAKRRVIELETKAFKEANLGNVRGVENLSQEAENIRRALSLPITTPPAPIREQAPAAEVQAPAPTVAAQGSLGAAEGAGGSIPATEEGVEKTIREFSAFPGGLLDPVVREAKKLVERFRRTPPLQDGAAPIPTARWTERAIQNAIDYFEPVARVERALAGESRPGQANLPDLEDAYLQETVRRGVTKTKLEELDAKHQKPMLQRMRAARITLDELDTFLMARNAHDGNKLIRARNFDKSLQYAPSTDLQEMAEFPTGERNLTRYGITDEQATEILDAVKADPRAAAFEDLGARFDALNGENLHRLVATGRKTQEQVDALRAAQPHYAPARTDMRGPDGKPVQVPSGAKRVGQPFKKALGRESLAEHPLAFAFAQAEQAIVQGEINKTRQAFLSMVRAYSGQLGDAIKIVETPMHRVLVNGEVRESFDQNFRNRNDVVTVWDKGKPISIQIDEKHADLAKALNQLGPDQVHGATKLASAFNRMRSALITRYRPFFWPFNMIRDVKSAAYLGSEFGARYAARVVADVPRSAATLAGKQTNLTPYVQRYKAAGGPVTFLDFSDLTTQLDKMQAALDDPQTSTGDKTIEGFKAIKRAMETTSDIGENATRFSAFVHAIEDLGWTDARAAAYAKELQNFERKGFSGNAVNAWYMFANAGIQATRRFAQATRNPAIRRMLAYSFVSAMGWDQLQRALGGKDDDGEDRWDKIPDYEKQGNFIFMYPDGSGRRVTIPAPFVFGAVNYTGQQLGALLSGNIGPGKFLASSTEAWINAVNPLGSISGSDGQGFLRALTPDIARLPLEIATNRDWRGKPIYADKFDKRAPDSANNWPDTNPLAKAAAEFLNRATGGDKYEPGTIDVAPETLEHVAYFFGAGLPQDILTVGQQARKLAAGEPIPMRDVPLLKRIIRDPSPFASWSEQEDLLYALKAEEKRAADEKQKLPKSARAAIELGEAVQRDRDLSKRPKKGSGKTPLDEMAEREKAKELQRLDLAAQSWTRRAREELKKLR